MAKSSKKKARHSANATSAKNKKEYARQSQKVTEQKGKEQKPPKKKDPTKRSAFASAFPYILVVFALVLAICFVTVQLLGMDDGAGIVGYAVQWFFCGLLGIAAFLMPLAMGYVGILYILFHIRFKPKDYNEDRQSEYGYARRRITMKAWMTFLTVVLLALAISVIANEGYEVLELGQMWTDGAEDLVGGGLLGGFFGTLMVLAFRQVISMVLLVVGLVVTVVFAIGLTPDYIVAKIQEKQVAKREQRAALAAEAAEEKAAREREAKQHAARMAAAHVPPAAPNGRRQSMSADEIEDLSNEAWENEPSPAHQPPEPYIGPSEDMINKKMAETVFDVPAEPEQKPLYSAEEAESDFGGDESLDGTEYSPLDDFIRNAGLKSDAADAPEAVKDEPIEMNRIENEELLSDMAAIVPEEGEAEEIEEPEMPYVFPPMDLLEKNPDQADTDYTEELQTNARRLVETLRNFKVGVQEITYSRGPTITRYELKPSAGVKVRSIANLVDDIALSLATSGVRIEAPIPNKPAVGIEVPNRNRATVYLRDLIDNPKFKEAKSRLTSSLGMDVGGNPIYFDIAKMPHLLIAGATGMGKSVCINSVIVSLLYKAKPEEVKLILIDPKKVEFNIYKDIPHLYAPIISDPKKAAGALASAVAEMERRFELIEEVGVRDITTYNAVTENDPEKEHMTHMVIIIDELADLMMTAKDEVETSICRLAQKARAAGIHIIIGTQRPSVDVITGLIKANVPSRIACTVASQVDSRTIIDIAGAEKLIGRGDMLFAPVGSAKPMRVQGSFVSEAEVEKIVTYIKENNARAKYNKDFVNRIEEEAAKCGMGKKGAAAGDMIVDDEVEGGDSKFREAVKLAIESGKISTSLMQRRLGVGYGRAAKIIDTMEQLGYVSRPDGNKPRNVLITMDEYMRRVTEGTLGGTEE